MRYTVRESFTAEQVDRANGVVRGVKLISPKSRNGRVYSPRAIEQAGKHYENLGVYIDHPPGENNARKLSDRFGRIVNVRPAPDGGRVGDLKFNPAHPFAESFLWYAEHDPRNIGFSHNAEGNGRRQDDGTTLIEEVTKVHSLDLVDGPATTMSLYEQELDMNPVTDPATGGATGGDDFASQLSALASTIAGHPEWDKATKLSKLKALINMLEEGDGGEKKDDQGEGEEIPEPEMMEQLGRFQHPAVKAARKKLLREAVKAEAVKAGIPADKLTPVFVEQLAAAPVKLRESLIADRKSLLPNPAAADARDPFTAPVVAKNLDPKAVAAELFK